MIGRGIEAAERRAPSRRMSMQGHRADALRTTLTALTVRRGGFHDPYERSESQYQAVPLIRTGIDEALRSATPGSSQEADALLLQKMLDHFETQGFADPVPWIKTRTTRKGQEEPYEAVLTRVEYLDDIDIRVIGMTIGAKSVPVAKKPHFDHIPETHALVHNATGVRLDFSNQHVYVGAPKLSDYRRPHERALIVETGGEEVTFWGRGSYSPVIETHDWATQITFNREGHTGFQIMPYEEVPPIIASTFGPFDRA